MARDKDCIWHFDSETGQHEGPNDALIQHFKRNPYGALIRESIQNSLDVVLDTTQPVRINVDFKELKSLDFPEFFNLRNHIKGCIDLYIENQTAKDLYGPMLDYFTEDYAQSIGYIRITDANTKGMPYINGDTNCEFYAFVRSRGVSAKADQSAGGSFGFGKAAYFNISPIRTVMVSTLTRGGQYVFEGVSSLCTHKVDGNILTSVGFYDNNNGKPITHMDNIPIPFKCQEPGTSFSIMGFDLSQKDNAKKEMKEAVLRNFWMAIWENQLTVTIDGEEICKENLTQQMLSTFSETLDAAKKTNYYNPTPYFLAVAMAGKEDRYRKITAKIDYLDEVELYININSDATDKMVFMRKQLMLIYAKKTQTNHGFNGVFVCRSKWGNDLLRKMENPAHDEWKPEYWKDNNNRTNQKGHAVLESLNKFIGDSLKQLFASDSTEALLITGLEDYLYVPESLVEDDEPKFNHEATSGVPSGEFIPEGSSVTTTIDDIEPSTESDNQKPQTGSVILTQGGDIKPHTKGSTIAGTGHSKKHSKTKGGNPIGGHSFGPTEIDTNGNGSYLEYIPVTFRVAAQNEGGKCYHTIIFHSPQSTNSVEIELAVGGEQNDEILEIVEASAGEIHDNFVSNLAVQEGKNEIKVRFSDNMKHAVILKAYEHK